MREARVATFEVYKDAHGQFRWRLKSSNGRSIATSDEGYKSKAGVQDGIAAVKREAAAADVDDQTGTTF
jgi:uncharacterized protein YegP (UPF0339 family)